MKKVKIIMHDGLSIIINNCKDLTWSADKNIIIVEKENGRNVIFNVDFVQYAGYLEDLEEGWIR